MKRKQRRNAERRRSIETRASVGLHQDHPSRVVRLARVRPRRSRAFLVCYPSRCAGGSPTHGPHTSERSRLVRVARGAGPVLVSGDGDASFPSGATRRRNGSSRCESAVTFAFPRGGARRREGRARPGGSGSLGGFRGLSHEERKIAASSSGPSHRAPPRSSRAHCARRRSRRRH